jgi:hypothetical protein
MATPPNATPPIPRAADLNRNQWTLVPCIHCEDARGIRFNMERIFIPFNVLMQGPCIMRIPAQTLSPPVDGHPARIIQFDMLIPIPAPNLITGPEAPADGAPLLVSPPTPAPTQTPWKPRPDATRITADIIARDTEIQQALQQGRERGNEVSKPKNLIRPLIQ